MQRSSRFREIFRNKSAQGLVIAHRGASSLAPENTLPAAALGKASGAVAWEFDVHLSRDGVPVVIHDESLLRTTDVAEKYPEDPRASRGYLVADFDFNELMTLDAGSWFLNPAGVHRSASDFGTLDLISPAVSELIRRQSVRIPTLTEALQWTRAEDWLANVELKSYPHFDPHLTNAVLKAIAEMDTPENIWISSFDHREIRRVVDMAPWIATAALCATPIGRPAQYVHEVLGVDALHVSAEVIGSRSLAYMQASGPQSLALNEILELRARGIPLLVYTVNETELATHLFQAGVPAIFSDVPARLSGMKWTQGANVHG